MSILKEKEKFWNDDPNVLFDNYLEFFPKESNTLEQNLNALMRLGIYSTVLMSMSEGNIKPLRYAMAVMVVTFLIHSYYEEKMSSHSAADVAAPSATVSAIGFELEKFEDSQHTKCQLPTESNPFMNVTYVDQIEKPNRDAACDVNDPEVKTLMEKHFSRNLYRDASDLFGKNNSARQFFTMPYTTIPNNQDEFAKWLYSSPKTCKEDQDYCLRYEDVRAKRPVLRDPDMNPVETEAKNK